MRFPLREWGWDEAAVWAYLERRNVSIPARTDCARCYHQRIGEWWALRRDHADIFAEAEAQEAEIEATFRTPGRDTWPTASRDLRAELRAAGNPKSTANSICSATWGLAVSARPTSLSCFSACERRAAPAALAYADPPYPAARIMYRDHPDYAGEVDHAELIERLERDYDGWVLHTNSVSIPLIAPLVPAGARWMAWVKPFAAFKANVPVAYAWEPVIVKAARKPQVSKRMVTQIGFRSRLRLRGLTGAKPERVCSWAFEVMGAEPAII